jgi:hypothetical protein
MNATLQMIRKYKKHGDLRSSIKFSQSTLYVVRLKKSYDSNYKFGISKPCINCQRNMHKFNVSRVFYTDVIDDVEVVCEFKRNPEVNSNIIPLIKKDKSDDSEDMDYDSSDSDSSCSTASSVSSRKKRKYGKLKIILPK